MFIKFRQWWGKDVDEGGGVMGNGVMGNFRTLFAPINPQEGKKPERHEGKNPLLILSELQYHMYISQIRGVLFLNKKQTPYSNPDYPSRNRYSHYT